VGRRAVAGQDGTWSLRQACTQFDLPDRAARAAVSPDRGLIDTAGAADTARLTVADVLVLRALVTVDTSKHLDPGDPVSAAIRDTALAALAREAHRQQVPAGTVLFVSSRTVLLARTPAEKSVGMNDAGGQPFTGLPIGRWVAELSNGQAAA
jgi:hypothetical protein